jgi:hypothetical protein
MSEETGVDCAHGGDPAATLSKVLYRFGEIVMLQADLHQGLTAWNSARTFLMSHCIFRLADYLRIAVFRANPLGRDYSVDANASRNAIRVSLKLAKKVEYLPATSREQSEKNDEWQRYFVREARRCADIYCRHHRFDPDQVSQWLLEAATVRVVGPRESRWKNLSLAVKWIAQADDLLVTLQSRPRLRMRHLLERAKCFRALAEVEMECNDNHGQERAKRYFRIAKFDVQQLELLASAYLTEGLSVLNSQSFWGHIVAKQKRMIEALEHVMRSRK